MAGTPDHPITVTPNPNRVKVTFAGKVVADTTQGAEPEGSQLSAGAVRAARRRRHDPAHPHRAQHALSLQGRCVVLFDQCRRHARRKMRSGATRRRVRHGGDRRLRRVLSEPRRLNRRVAGAVRARRVWTNRRGAKRPKFNLRLSLSSFNGENRGFPRVSWGCRHHPALSCREKMVIGLLLQSPKSEYWTMTLRLTVAAIFALGVAGLSGPASAQIFFPNRRSRRGAAC